MISAPGRSAYWTPSYQHSDAKRWTLESRLGQFLSDLESAAARAEEQRIEQERQEASARRRWYQAVREGRERQVDKHRQQALTDQVARWKEAEAIRAFCAAVRTRHPCGLHEDAQKWLDWAERHADTIDPLPTRLGTPQDPPATRQALQDHLRGDLFAYPWPYDEGRWTLDSDESPPLRP
ncbi:hypothetical protein ABZ070_35440 [Streptomyces sp. NPDC006283]|uniref:hypothetical protein n=1 Tax=Streptomyces sp. NPDC006283 TaxID=3156741 RepID=UPI0033BE6463